ncbi:hypothetical protein DFH27DRAFT_616770 [Peziza echinospora]|nr:hypothetical protein DFH27DRAFT_616770 [Peziza echinospora]
MYAIAVGGGERPSRYVRKTANTTSPGTQHGPSLHDGRDVTNNMWEKHDDMNALSFQESLQCLEKGRSIRSPQASKMNTKSVAFAAGSCPVDPMINIHAEASTKRQKQHELQDVVESRQLVHYVPRPCPPPTILHISPASLAQMTPSRLAELLRSLPDTHSLRIPAIPYSDFRQWWAGDGYGIDEDDYEYGEDAAAARAKRAVRYVPSGGSWGEHSQEGLVGDVLLQCMASPYHDAVVPGLAAGIKNGACKAQGKPDGAESGLVCVATPEITGLKPSAVFPSVSGDMVRMPDGAVFIKSAGGQCGIFPAVVIEVGFSETLDKLVHDVAVFLLGTGGATKVGIVVKLVELMALVRSEERVQQPRLAKKRPREADDDADNELQWPTAPLGSTSSPLPLPPAPPSAMSTPAERENALNRLQEWYVQTDGTTLHSGQRLVGPLDAWIHIYRRTSDMHNDQGNQQQQQQQPEQGQQQQGQQQQGHQQQGHQQQGQQQRGQKQASVPGISCVSSTKFLEHDVAIKDATFNLSLEDVYEQNVVTPANTTNTTTLTLPLAPIGAEILSNRTQMLHKRAWQLARRVYDAHLSSMAKARNKRTAATASGASTRTVLGALTTRVLPNGMVLRPRELRNAGDENINNVDDAVAPELMGGKDDKTATAESWIDVRKAALAEWEG